MPDKDTNSTDVLSEVIEKHLSTFEASTYLILSFLAVCTDSSQRSDDNVIPLMPTVADALAWRGLGDDAKGRAAELASMDRAEPP